MFISLFTAKIANCPVRKNKNNNLLKIYYPFLVLGLVVGGIVRWGGRLQYRKNTAKQALL